MHRLIEIGFERIGAWRMSEGELFFELEKHAKTKNVLYCFATGGTPLYVGKTTQMLSSRLGGYRKPGATQQTNKKVNEGIAGILQNAAGSEDAVEIYVFVDSGHLRFGDYHLNLAAGLEDSLIRAIDPPWNGRQSPPQPETTTSPADETGEGPSPKFPVTLGTAYYELGFCCNVGVEHNARIGSDGEELTVTLPNDEVIECKINRTANPNGTPRIYGGKVWREYVQANHGLGDVLEFEIISPHRLRIV
jgi:hypothetical protein